MSRREKSGWGGTGVWGYRSYIKRHIEKKTHQPPEKKSSGFFFSEVSHSLVHPCEVYRYMAMCAPPLYVFLSKATSTHTHTQTYTYILNTHTHTLVCILPKEKSSYYRGVCV